MGYALNAAIAGILAKPAPAAAICLAGDGGFQMSLQELATFEQMKRPGDKMLVIVFDNKLLGRVLFGFDQAGGCDILGPDYARLAEAYGGQGARLDDANKVDDILKKALESDGLFMLHVIVDPTCKADMASFKDKAISVMNSG
jgi:acetolactate synthase-1/2/3 large subunit